MKGENKMFKLMVMMMLASCISGRYEVTGGTVLNTSGDGHLDWSSKYAVEDPYTYIAYDKGLQAGTQVTSLFMYGSDEPDDIVLRIDKGQQ